MIYRFNISIDVLVKDVSQKVLETSPDVPFDDHPQFARAIIKSQLDDLFFKVEEVLDYKILEGVPIKNDKTP